MYMEESYNINRMEYLILNTLYAAKCKDHYDSMTISELMEDTTDESGQCVLGVRLTIYKKLQKLVKASFINKGILDARADTYFITEKGINLIERRERV